MPLPQLRCKQGNVPMSVVHWILFTSKWKGRGRKERKIRKKEAGGVRRKEHERETSL